MGQIIRYSTCPHCGRGVTVVISERIIRDIHGEGKIIEVELQKPD
jgi:hypothetical protein